MSIKIEKGRLTIFRYFILFITVMYMGGLTMFTHTHQVHGVIVVHFFPFTPASDTQPSHESTEQEVMLLNYFYNTQMVDTIIPEVSPSAIFTLICTLYYQDSRSEVTVRYMQTYDLRAPPMV